MGGKKDIKVLPTGVNYSELKKRTKKEIEDFKKKYGLEKNDKILLFLARIAKEKNIDFLLKVMEGLEKNYKLLIVGDGPYKKEIEEKAKKKKLNIIFAGYLDRNKVALAYQVSNLFVFSSSSETQGLVLAEAMGSGLPIVAINDPATADMVKNNENGYLTRKNPKEFREKIKKLFKNKVLWQKMSKKGRIKAKEFSIEKKTKELIKIYQKEIDKKFEEK